MKEFIITEKEAGQRLDKYLLKYLNRAPKSFVYKMLRKKNIKLNKNKATGNELLTKEDLVQLFLSDATIEEFRQVNESKVDYSRLDIVYEDKHLMLINKPIGLLTQKEDKKSISVIDMAISYLQDKGEYDPNIDIGTKPGLCNRLDRNTSGLVIVGKNLNALQQLNKAIREHEVDKFYMTLAKGEVKEPIVLDNYLVKDSVTNKVSIHQKRLENSTHVKTRIKPIRTFGNYTLCEIQLITGKSHQIRAHMSSIHHPILGDSKYGDSMENLRFKKTCGLSTQLLHAYKITFSGLEEPIAYLNGKSFFAKEPLIYKQAIKTMERGNSNDSKRS